MSLTAQLRSRMGYLGRCLSEAQARGSLRTVQQQQPEVGSRTFASSGDYHATTVLCVRKEGEVVVMADGQVTMGSQVVKPNVNKVRRLHDTVIGGFAGTTTDAITLFELLESRLEEHPGQLKRAAVELAKAWRTDKILRRLDAVMIVADKDVSLQVTGNGDVLEPHDGIIAIGSGGNFALAAARALIDMPGMDAESIARKSMTIAADCCVYTNHNFKVETLSASTAAGGGKEKAK